MWCLTVDISWAATGRSNPTSARQHKGQDGEQDFALEHGTGNCDAECEAEDSEGWEDEDRGVGALHEHQIWLSQLRR